MVDPSTPSNHEPNPTPTYIHVSDDHLTEDESSTPPSGAATSATTTVGGSDDAAASSPVTLSGEEDTLGPLAYDDNLNRGRPVGRKLGTVASTTDPRRAPSISARIVIKEDSEKHGHTYASVRPTLGRNTSTTATVLSRSLSRIRSRNPGADREFSHRLERTVTGPDCIVDFDGDDDPYKALNWSPKKKWIAVALYGITTGTVTFDSSIFSVATAPIQEEYGVNEYVATLGVTLMLLGFGIGPLLWAPLSELYGRKMAVLLPFAISVCFTFATGASKDIQSILITRFFSGFFAAAPITNTGGVLGDMFAPATRGKALVAYASAVVGGPTLGPLVGNALLEAGLSWRWTEYLTGIMKSAVLFADLLLLDESYTPTLLKYKARKLRASTGNWALHAESEEPQFSLRDIAEKYLVRPFQLLMTPICFLVALYASFCYGLLYSLLGSIPIAFEELRGWSPVVGSLPFVAVLVGVSVAGCINIANQVYYCRRLDANGGKAVPEARLPPMMIGSLCLSSALWIFAWTPAPIHWSAQVIACALFGCGFFAIFQAALNYLIDTFQTWGASAIAANTFLRSVFAGTFPLFIEPQLKGLGFSWGMTVFAFVSVAMIPIPYLFFFYGAKIRARGKWSRASCE